MKFRLKIMLSMLCLLALLFGTGGSLLIAQSFESSLDRQEESARDSHQLILDALAAVSSLDAWTTSNDASSLIERLHAQSASSWTAMRFSSEDKVLYESGATGLGFADDRSGIDAGHSALFTLSDGDRRYVQLTGALVIGDELYYLDAVHDLTPLYETRDQQQAAFRTIFLVLIVCCAAMAWGIAWFLTKPLSLLSHAARELASGNLAHRSNVRSSDEVGALSADFDAMAQQLERSVHDMQQSLERQERFMGHFAHEVKTPMTSIIGYADLMRHDGLDPADRADAASYIFSEGKRLENLSLKLLDLFVVGKTDFHLDEHEPAQLVEDAVANEKPRCEEAGANLTCRCERGLCLLEPDLVRSLLLNLIENARKAVDGAGVIRVTCTMLPDGCRLRVEDTGKGIPEEALPQVTEAFYRADTARSRAEGGAGLGLSLCARIAQLHHGDLHIESSPGRGTRVTVDLRGGRS